MIEESMERRSGSRERLSKLLREGGTLLTVESAARILDVTNDDAAKALPLASPGLVRASSVGFMLPCHSKRPAPNRC